MAEQVLSAHVPATPKPAAASRSGTFVPRLITGLGIVFVWEIVVRAFAPAYVAKPSAVILVIPKVLSDPTFQKALGSTLSAVAEGLAITIVIGTVLGLLMGRSPTFDRVFRVYVNGFNADDHRAAVVFIVVRILGCRPHRNDHLRRNICHYDERGRRRSLGAP